MDELYPDIDIEQVDMQATARSHDAARRRISRARLAVNGGDPDGPAELADAMFDCPHAYMQGAEGWNREHPDATPIPHGTVRCLDACGRVIDDPSS